MISPPILILHAPGTNRDGDLARAFELAGGKPQIVPLTLLRSGEVHWQDFAMLALPGGFSYGDALGAGRLWALDLQTWFAEALQAFADSGKPVIGICNGFQALVKSGILPGNTKPATLTFNASGHFECRWVNLTPSKVNPSPWVAGLPAITCPIAHGEGRFLLAEGQSLPGSQIALVYSNPDGTPAGGAYPLNPNGSVTDIAGITNAGGNVIGMMPHPEDHVYPHQHPAWTRRESGGLALQLFQNGIRMA
jgi:phosphoribosylformylglycinamidine synthase subunit PurQ / glutaminase